MRPSDFIVEEVHPQRPPPPEPEAEPQWLEFTLHKTLLGTLDAIQELAAELRVPPATFTVAGLKDSHALTTQRVTVRRGALDEQQIRRAADALPRLAVDSFCCVARPLKAGHSSGNRFRLAVRGLLAAARPTEAVVSAVRQRGFINYYGLQRFGHTGTRNPAVGRAYLARQYSQMVDAILGYPPGLWLGQGDGGADRVCRRATAGWRCSSCRRSAASSATSSPRCSAPTPPPSTAPAPAARRQAGSGSSARRRRAGVRFSPSRCRRGCSLPTPTSTCCGTRWRRNASEGTA